jgi:hypothetical protein
MAATFSLLGSLCSFILNVCERADASSPDLFAIVEAPHAPPLLRHPGSPGLRRKTMLGERWECLAMAPKRQGNKGSDHTSSVIFPAQQPSIYCRPEGGIRTRKGGFCCASNACGGRVKSVRQSRVVLSRPKTSRVNWHASVPAAELSSRLACIAKHARCIRCDVYRLNPWQKAARAFHPVVVEASRCDYCLSCHRKLKQCSNLRGRHQNST